jgi:hypothetical protein
LFRCWLCRLTKDNWKALSEFDVGQLVETANELDGKASNMGVKTKPLFRIGPDRYLMPPVHLLLGPANDIWAGLRRYIRGRDGLDLLVVPLQDAWDAKWEASGELKVAKEALLLWTLLNESELVQLRNTRSLLIDWIGQTDFYTSDERKDMKVEKTGVSGSIMQLEKAFKAAEELVKERSKAHKDALGALKKLQETHHSTEEPLWYKVERIVKNYNVDCAAYYGGALVGNCCRNVLGNAKAIMGEIKALLTNAAKTNSMSDVGITGRANRHCSPNTGRRGMNFGQI